ncbi:hypothetical protein EDB83DRAFT_2312719 [Lactarius deliciosus]|nr:hypothetical protein EDB83DRAFT_2312719 [Lactarius deliciosus]
MPLTIVLNTLYSSKGCKQEWETAESRILAHFVRMGFEKNGVEVATVKNTGWHSENGAVQYRGHLTVEFSKQNSKFTTKHVYHTDTAYEGRTGVKANLERTQETAGTQESSASPQNALEI